MLQNVYLTSEFVNVCVEVSVSSHWVSRSYFYSCFAQIEDLCEKVLLVTSLVPSSCFSPPPPVQPLSRAKRNGIESGKREKDTLTHRDILPALGAACVKAPGEPSVSVCRYMAARLASSQQQRNKSWSYNNASVDLLLFRDRRWMVPLF